MTRVGIGPATLRVALAAVVVLDLFSFYVFIGDARERAFARGGPIVWFVAAFSSAPVRALIVAIGVGGAVAFARAAGRLKAGLLAFIALTLLSTVHAILFGSPWRHLYYSGVCLFGWLVGLAVSLGAGRRTDESYARMGSVALLGAAYLNAGISKIAFSGVEWTWGVPIQAVVVAQDGLVRDSGVSAYRSWVVMSPLIAGLFSFATMIFELAGPLMILGGWWSAAVALGLLSMHFNIYILTDILYWESMVLLFVFGLLPYAQDAQAHTTTLPVLASRAGFIGSVVTLSVVALVAIVHQHNRYYASMATPAVPDRPRVAAAEAEPVRPSELAPSPLAPQTPSLRRIGPFAVGDQVTDAWTIEALTPADGRFTVALRGPTGLARFEVNCTDRDHRSPFDVGPARIFYPGELALEVVRPVGDALRDRVRRAAGQDDPCRAVNQWLQAMR